MLSQIDGSWVVLCVCQEAKASMQQKKKDGEKKLVADSSTPALATAVTPSTDGEVAEVAEVKAAYGRGELPWTYATVQSLITPYPRKRGFGCAAH